LVDEDGNTIGTNTSLYNQTYKKIVDQSASENTDPIRNKMEIRHVSGATYSDIIISCILDYGEPDGQEAYDNSQDLNGDFVFDEKTLFCSQKVYQEDKLKIV
jgi:hypothetical protein